MNEEKETQSPQEQEEGKPKEEAKKIVTKEELEEREDLIAKQEDLNAREDALKEREKLGGKSEAGFKPKPKVETPKEYRTRIEKEMQEGKTEFGN